MTKTDGKISIWGREGVRTGDKKEEGFERATGGRGGGGRGTRAKGRGEGRKGEGREMGEYMKEEAEVRVVAWRGDGQEVQK